MTKTLKILLYFLLLVFWLVQTTYYIYNQDFGIPSLNDRFSFRNFSSSHKEMFRNDLLSATFKSHYTNLGIIQVRFNNFKRMSDDILIFRIREKGNTEWYYQANYKTDQFQDNQLFPFGFPLIQDSQNKEYEFEIISQRGNKKNNVGASTSYPSFVAKHIYSRSMLSDRSELISFIIKKFFNTITDWNVIKRSVAYLIPFLIYTQFERFINFKRFNRFKRFFIYNVSIAKGIVFLSIILELVIGETSFDGFFLSIILFWFLTIKEYNLGYKVSAAMGGYLIILIPFLIIFDLTMAAEKLFEWVFIFFTIGFAQLGFTKIKEQFGGKHLLIKTVQPIFVKKAKKTTHLVKR